MINYYISKLNQNQTINKKYIYSEGIECNITQNFNIWYIDLDYFVIGNYYLPENIFMMDFSIPNIKTENISLTQKNHIPPFWINDYEYCKIYNINFEFDITDYFNSGNNFDEIKIITNLRINNEWLDKNEVNYYDQNTKNEFLNELNCIHTEHLLNYSSTEEIENSAVSCLNVEYFLDHDGNCYVNEDNKILCLLNNLENIETPILNLAQIYVDKQIMIKNISYKIDIEQLSNSKKQTLSIEEEKNIYTNNFNFCINSYSYYKLLDNELVLTNNKSDINGIFIPFESIGEINITMNYIVNNTLKTMKIKMKFSFANCIEKNEYSINIEEHEESNIPLFDVKSTNLQYEIMEGEIKDEEN